MPTFEESFSSPYDHLLLTSSQTALFALGAAITFTVLNSPISYPWGLFSASGSEKLLTWLYTLWKFLLVDTYSLVLMTMVAFRVHVERQELSVDLFVSPIGRFYVFLLTGAAALVLGYAAYAMTGVKRERRKFPYGGRKESLYHHSYQISSDGQLWKLTFQFRAFVLLGLITSAVLITIGVQKECFVFAKKALENSKVVTHSLLSLTQQLPSFVEASDANWIVIFQGFIYVFAFGMPIVCFTILTILYLMPLTGAAHNTLFQIAEATSACSVTEMLLACLFSSFVRISKGVSFISCSALRMALHVEDQSVDFPEPSVNQRCIHVAASMGGNVWYLVCGVVINAVATFVLLRLAKQSLDERLISEGVMKRHESGDIRDTEKRCEEDPTFVESLDYVLCNSMIELNVESTYGYVYWPLEDKAISSIEAHVALPVLV